tara:strand:+ start:174 stop:659 length:486 start_codon:yes stop_codon:yes gene_type:complete
MSNLLVQNIKHTNGTVAQTIDSSGRVTTSTNRPAFMARRTSNQSAGTVVFDTVMINQGSHYDNSNGRFTAPIAGLYSFSCCVLTDNDGTNAYFNTNIAINGAIYAVYQGRTEDDNDFPGIVNVIASLSASDYVEVTHPDTAVYGTSSATANFTWFCGYLIG